jgi:transposase
MVMTYNYRRLLPSITPHPLTPRLYKKYQKYFKNNLIIRNFFDNLDVYRVELINIIFTYEGSMSTEPENLFNDPSLPKQSGKRRKAKSAPVFKSYQQHQMMLLPPSLEEMIPEKHLVRVVNQTIDELNVDALLETYKGGGASAYHPKMMLKVLIYAYLSKIYSSRQIAKALRQDINFMWISGMQQPEFSIINHFRSSRLKDVVDQVFGSMVFFLLEHGYIDLQQYFVDGTKLRADSNKHKVVWAKNTRRYKEKVQQKINELLREIERTNTQEQDRYGDRDLEELGEHTTLTSEGVKEQVDTLNKIIEHTAPAKHASKAVEGDRDEASPQTRKIRAAGRDFSRAQQLCQDRSRRHGLSHQR